MIQSSCLPFVSIVVLVGLEFNFKFNQGHCNLQKPLAILQFYNDQICNKDDCRLQRRLVILIAR